MGNKGRLNRRTKHRREQPPEPRPTLATMRVSLLLAAFVALLLLTLVLLPNIKWSHNNGNGNNNVEDNNPLHVLPVAVATCQKTEGHTGDTFFLNGSLSHAYRGALIMNYSWEVHEDWLSGPIISIKYGEFVNLTIVKPGGYYIVLTVIDKWGNSNTTVSKDQYKGIAITVEDWPPVAVINGNNVTTVGNPISFSGSGSHDSDGSVVDYQWDFGDGTTGTGAAVSHAYGHTGTFTVTLTVRDDYGQVGVSTVKVVVK